MKKDIKDSGLTPIRTGYINDSPNPVAKTTKTTKTNTAAAKKSTMKNTKTKVTPTQLTKIMRETFNSEGVPCGTVYADFSGNPNEPTSIGFKYKPNSLDFISYSFVHLHFSPLLASAPIPVIKDVAKMVAAMLTHRPVSRTPLVQSWIDTNKDRWEKMNISVSPEPKKKNNSADKSMKNVKGMYSFKAARGNHTRGPFEMTLKQAIKYAAKWSEDSDWDYEYGVDFVPINVYCDGKPIGYIDDIVGDWHRGKTVKED